MAESGEAALGRFPGRSLCPVLVRPWSSSAPGPAQPLGAADAAHPQAAAFPVKNPTNNLPPCRMKQELEFFLISTKQPANPGMQSSFSTRAATQPRHDFQVRSSLMGWCMGLAGLGSCGERDCCHLDGPRALHLYSGIAWARVGVLWFLSGAASANLHFCFQENQMWVIRRQLCCWHLVCSVKIHLSF